MLRAYTSRLAPYAPVILRIVAGITFFLHGLPKIQNFGNLGGMFGGMGVPAPGILGPLVALLETVGAILLIVGFQTRWIALMFVIEMVVTTLLVKSQIGFIAPRGAGAGAELDILLLAASLALLFLGPGRLSVDRDVLKQEVEPAG